MGSEGECGVVARNLSDLLWVPADGFGPREAALDHDQGRTLIARAPPPVGAGPTSTGRCPPVVARYMRAGAGQLPTPSLGLAGSRSGASSAAGDRMDSVMTTGKGHAA